MLYSFLVGAALVITGMTTESVGPLISGSGAVSVIAALTLTMWSPRSTKAVPVALVLAATVSLAVTFFYQGPAHSAAANWWTAETVALMLLLVVGARRAHAWTAKSLAVLLTTALVLSPLRITLNVVPPSSRGETLQLCLIWAILALIALGVGAYLRELDARSRATAAAERRAERLRLARDLHDYAAHDVTAVVVLVEAAQVLAKEDPQQALALLPEIGSAGTQALQAMDHTLQLLGDAPSPEEQERILEPPSRRALASETRDNAEGGAGPHGHRGQRRDLSELAPLVTRFNRTGPPEAVLVLADALVESVPADVSVVGYRVIVEALTNVRRHAVTASRVEILLRREEVDDTPALRLQVTDDAPQPMSAPALAERAPGAGGTGISGLSERVSNLGGTLTAGPHEGGGWRVMATFPLAGSCGTQERRNLPNG
ncbi:sensor histidine kinase [Streptomyces rugosispiralis]|uniref:histidine kinase n=1 Tax=Streptomyces rugosispiralis TaxID=2967341 RepID=A0ABT1VAJ9_9ACTN|nr:sensor histidine kinase [Streptomyces rugosispiralis]MCQ8194424.1 histidine kinase [Streptomyces rugosispiralis]